MQDFDFFTPEEAIFAQTILPYQQKIQQVEKRVVFSGFPYDQGTRRNGGRIGGSVASKIFRQTLGKLEVYPNRLVKVYDSGDIEEDLELELAHQKLQSKHIKILKQGSQTLLVAIGGSNDQSYPNVAALMSAYPGKRLAVINLDSHFDVRPLKQGKAHSGSPFRQMLQDKRFHQSNSIFVQFGAKGATCSNNHYLYLQQHKAEVYWMQKNIRRHEVSKDSQWRTQAGQVFADIMKGFEQKVDVIFASFDVDVINSKWMPGVSAPSVLGGLTSDESLEIVRIAGKSAKVRMVDFSQFNPAVQSVLSSHLLSELFFELCMSFGERQQ